MLSLNITADTVTKSSQSITTTTMPEPRPAEVAHDIESLYGDERFTDFKIICKEHKDGQNKDEEAKLRILPVHKVVLAARSPVFGESLE